MKKIKAKEHELELRATPTMRTYVKNNLRIISSFSYYHWRVLEMFEQHEIDVKDINPSILDEMVDIVLPDGENILSRLI